MVARAETCFGNEIKNFLILKLVLVRKCFIALFYEIASYYVTCEAVSRRQLYLYQYGLLIWT